MRSLKIRVEDARRTQVILMLGDSPGQVPSHARHDDRTGAASLLIAMVLSFLPISASTQASPANISGFTQDQLEHPLSGAAVSATSTQTGVKYQAKTDRAGNFDFIGVPAGYYVIEARFPGFQTFTDVIPMGGADVRRAITLDVEPVQEMLTISAKDIALSVVEDRPDTRKPTAAAATDRCAQSPTAGCVVPPTRTRIVRPPYQGVDGKVVLEGEIGVDGMVRQIEVTTQGDVRLGNAVVDAVSQWHFTPTRLDGTLIASHLVVTALFQADASSPPR